MRIILITVICILLFCIFLLYRVTKKKGGYASIHDISLIGRKFKTKAVGLHCNLFVVTYEAYTNYICLNYIKHKYFISTLFHLIDIVSIMKDPYVYLVDKYNKMYGGTFKPEYNNMSVLLEIFNISKIEPTYRYVYELIHNRKTIFTFHTLLYEALHNIDGYDPFIKFIEKNLDELWNDMKNDMYIDHVEFIGQLVGGVKKELTRSKAIRYFKNGNNEWEVAENSVLVPKQNNQASATNTTTSEQTPTAAQTSATAIGQQPSFGKFVSQTKGVNTCGTCALYNILFVKHDETECYDLTYDMGEKTTPSATTMASFIEVFSNDGKPRYRTIGLGIDYKTRLNSLTKKILNSIFGPSYFHFLVLTMTINEEGPHPTYKNPHWMGLKIVDESLYLYDSCKNGPILLLVNEEKANEKVLYVADILGLSNRQVEGLKNALSNRDFIIIHDNMDLKGISATSSGQTSANLEQRSNISSSAQFCGEMEEEEVRDNNDEEICNERILSTQASVESMLMGNGLTAEDVFNIYSSVFPSLLPPQTNPTIPNSVSQVQSSNSIFPPFSSPSTRSFNTTSKSISSSWTKNEKSGMRNHMPNKKHPKTKGGVKMKYSDVIKCQSDSLLGAILTVLKLNIRVWFEKSETVCREAFKYYECKRNSNEVEIFEHDIGKKKKDGKEENNDIADIYPAEKVALFLVYACFYIPNYRGKGGIVNLDIKLASYLLYVYLFNSACACIMDSSWNQSLSNEYVYIYNNNGRGTLENIMENCDYKKYNKVKLIRDVKSGEISLLEAARDSKHVRKQVAKAHISSLSKRCKTIGETAAALSGLLGHSSDTTTDYTEDETSGQGFPLEELDDDKYQTPEEDEGEKKEPLGKKVEINVEPDPGPEETREHHELECFTLPMLRDNQKIIGDFESAREGCDKMQKIINKEKEIPSFEEMQDFFYYVSKVPTILDEIREKERTCDSSLKRVMSLETNFFFENKILLSFQLVKEVIKDLVHTIEIFDNDAENKKIILKFKKILKRNTIYRATKDFTKINEPYLDELKPIYSKKYEETKEEKKKELFHKGFFAVIKCQMYSIKQEDYEQCFIESYSAGFMNACNFLLFPKTLPEGIQLTAITLDALLYKLDPSSKQLWSLMTSIKRTINEIHGDINIINNGVNEIKNSLKKIKMSLPEDFEIVIKHQTISEIKKNINVDSYHINSKPQLIIQPMNVNPGKIGNPADLILPSEVLSPITTTLSDSDFNIDAISDENEKPKKDDVRKHLDDLLCTTLLRLNAIEKSFTYAKNDFKYIKNEICVRVLELKGKKEAVFLDLTDIYNNMKDVYGLIEIVVINISDIKKDINYLSDKNEPSSIRFETEKDGNGNDNE